MLLPAMLGFVSFAETTESGELSVSAATLQFSSKIYILVAVDYSELYSDYGSAKEKINVVVTDKQGVKTELKPDDSVATTQGFPENSVGFKFTDLGAKNMTDQLTVQAYNGTEESGSPVTYSVLEYAVKAKSEQPDNIALISALDAMLEFGAEAQKAFNYIGDYALYDEEGYIDYGMLIVYGGAPKKVFGKIGSTLTPEASADVGANAVLYDTAYDAIANNTLTVSAEPQKCFFVGDANTTPYNLDTDWYSGDVTRTYFNYNNWTKSSNASTSKEFNMQMDYTNKTITLNVSKTNNQATMWNVSGATNSKDLVTKNADGVITKYMDHGFRELGNGYLYINSNVTTSYTDIKAVANTGTVGQYTGITGVTENLKPTGGGYNFNYSGALASDMLGDDGKLTVTFTFKLAKNSNGDAIGFFNACRFRSKETTTYMYFYNNDASRAGKITLSNTGNEIRLSTEEWTTFHVVIDSKADLMQLYNSAGELVDTKTYANAEEYLTDTADYAYCNWNIGAGQAGYINKILFTKGNIFE